MEKKSKKVISILVIVFVLVIGTTNVMLVVGSEEESDGPMFEAMREDEDTVVLVNTNSEQKISTLHGHGEILDHYGRNVLLRTDRETARELEGEYRAQILDYRNEISVKGHTFDTSEGLPELDSELMIDSYESRTEGLYIVDMIGPVNPEWRAQLEDEGAKVINYQPNYAYEVIMTPEQAEEVEDFEFVDWVGVYQPEFKLHNQLDEALDKEMPVTVRLRPGFEANTLNDFKSEMSVLSTEDLREQGARLTLDVDSMAELEDLALEKDVYYISPYVEPELQGEMDIQQIGGGMWFMDDEYETRDDLPVDPREGDPQEPYRKHGEYGAYINQLGYSGEDITVAVADTGIGDGTVGDAGVEDFTGRVIGGYGFGQEDQWQDGNFHGTACTGLIAGDTYRGTGMTWDETDVGDMEYYMGQGLAYESEIFATKIFSDGGDFMPEEYYPIVEEPAQRSDAYIHSNSWGAPTLGEYSDSDEIFDQAVRDSDRETAENREMIITAAAGNDGAFGEQSIGSPGNAKNIITVGGNQPYNPGLGHENPEDMYASSSRGWTEDNRVKPDVIAPSDNVITQNTPLDDDGYISSSGTSYGNPLVAGAATIVVEWYEENYDETPSPAMVKSILINTANELNPEIGDTSGHIPNRDEGWGVPDISKLEYPTEYPIGFEFSDQETFLQTGDVEEYQVSPYEEDEPLKITLTWTDKHALEGDSIGGTPTLKNNLDLEVETPSGKIIRGNAFDQTGDGVSDDGFTYPDAEVMADFDHNDDGWDDVNNVQNVYIHPDEIESGTYTVNVIGANVPEDANDDGEANQDYALTIYNVPEVEVPDKEGEISLDRDEYAGDDIVEVKLSDVILKGKGTHDVDIASYNAEGEELENLSLTLEEEVQDEEATGVFFGDITLSVDEGDIGEEDALYVEHDGDITAWYWDEDPGHSDDIEDKNELLDSFGETLDEEINIAVVREEKYFDTEIGDVLEDYLPEEFTVDTLDADEMIGEMDYYDGFVLWRFGSDSLAEDFLDELGEEQGTVYLDSYTGAVDEAYGDAVKRLHNVRGNPADWTGHSMSGPIDIEIYKNHEIFEDVGEEGDVVTLCHDTGNVFGSYYDDYTGDNLAEVRYDDTDIGGGLGIDEDAREIILPAKSIDYFLEPDNPDWSEESWTLLANSVEYTVGERWLEVESPPNMVNSNDAHSVEIMVTNIDEDESETDVPVDVTIYDEEYEQEYFDETTITEIDPKEEILIEFNDWEPSDEGEYLLNITTEMHGEEHQLTMDISVENIDDVGIEEIISPVDCVNSEEAHEVETYAHNYGTIDHTDVPVETTISKEAVELHEDFEEDIPDEWTIDSTTDEPYTWHHDGFMAYVEGNQNIVQDERLISPTLDLTDAEGTSLEFHHDFSTSPVSGDSWGRVQVSEDGGDSWEMIEEWEAEESASGVFEYDISDYADGEEEVQVAFEWDSPGDVGGNFDDWRLYEVSVTYWEEEYFDETTVDVDARESVTATFDDWNPSEESNFLMNSTTDLEGDEDPTNDYATKWIEVINHHDVGVTEIFSPTGEAALEDIVNVSAVVENFGSYDETDVPVEAMISQIIETLQEGFEEEIPDEWDIDSTAEEPYSWHWHESFGGVPMAYVEEQEDWQDEWLISPVVDATDAEGMTLEVDHHFYTSVVSGDSYGRIKVSPDGGNSWEMIEEWQPEESASGVFEYDISDYADGEEEVQVAFVFNSTDADESTFDNWEIYDVTIVYTDSVYEDNITVDIDKQEEIVVNFADWNPTYEGEHRVTMSTNMEGDMDPTNDAKTGYITITDDVDIVVDEITKPEAEFWNETQPVEAILSNEGDYDEEDVPVQASIERVVGIMEDFSADFPPAGWQTDDWTQSQSNNAGGESPEAHLSRMDATGGYAYLESPAVDTTDLEDLTLEFYSYIDDFRGDYNARVLARSTIGNDWDDVTPWENPISGDVEPDHYEVDITEYIGRGTQIMFDIDDDSDFINWYINDLMMGYTEKDYTNTTQIDLEREETKTVEFPNWTPTAAGTYILNVTANHPDEDYPETASREKGVYARPSICDLEATSIDALQEPIFQYEEEVIGTVTNVGNRNITQETPVNMTIEPIQEDIPIYEDFSEGLPEGWKVEDKDQNDNTWEWSEEEQMKITPEDDLEHDILWTDITDATMGEQRVLLEFYSEFEGPNKRSLLISGDGGENYRKIDANVSEGDQLYDITPYASGQEEVMIGWELFSSEVEDEEYWAIDDVKLTNEYTVEEYHSTVYVEELNVTEEKQLQFENWTPDIDELPTEYLVTLTTDHPEDENLKNVEISERIFAREHVPPEKPTDPSPYDDKEDVTHSPMLNVTLYGDEQLDMDATFYLYDDKGNEIGNKTRSGISSGEEASVQFLLLETDSTFEWYVEVDDGIETNVSDNWTFHTYVPEGRWKSASANINIDPPGKPENLAVDWNDDVWDVEGNELTWDASPDDGGGYDDTDHYVIYRAPEETGPWNEDTILDTVEADSSEEYVYFDEGMADDGEQWHYVVRAVDRVGNMETNEEVVSELSVPSADDQQPPDGEWVEEFNQTLSVDVTNPTDEPLDVEFYDGITRNLIDSHSGVTEDGRLEVDWELEEEDMAQDHYWYVIVSYEDYNVGSINPQEYTLTVDTVGHGSIEIDPEEANYLEGTEVEIKAIPDDEWEFVNWIGDYEGTEEEITITMDEDKEITANFEYSKELEGEWHWLYGDDHRFEPGNAVGVGPGPIDWYGAMRLDLSDVTGGFISEVAYYDHDSGTGVFGDWAYGYVAEDDNGAPGTWLAETDKYEPEGAGWVELELDELVKIEEPGDYWIVIHLDDAGDGHFPFGVDETSYPDEGQWMTWEDPHEPGNWEASGIGAWGLEAYVEVPIDGDEGLASNEPMGSEVNISVLDTGPEPNHDGQVFVDILEDELDEAYNIVLETDWDDFMDNIEDYDAIVIQRISGTNAGVDTERANALWDAVTAEQGLVVLDSWGSLPGYSDGVICMNEATGDPVGPEGSIGLSHPINLEITEDHFIFDDVGDVGDVVNLYDTDRAFWFDDFIDEDYEIVGDVSVGGTVEGHGFAVNEVSNEVVLSTMGQTDSSFATKDYTPEAKTLLANSVNFALGEIEYEPMGWHFHLEDDVDPVAEAEIIEKEPYHQGDTITLSGTSSYNPASENTGIKEYLWEIEDPMGEVHIYEEPIVEFALEHALYYDITLTVYDAYGNHASDTFEVYAIDTEDPVADAGTHNQTRVGIEHTLECFSTDNVEVVDRDWTIKGVTGEAEGYEDTAEGEIVEYVFPYQGFYEVTLESSDAEGNTDTDTVSIVVNPALEAFEITTPEEDYQTIDKDTVTVEWEGHEYMEDLTYEIRLNYGDWDEIGTDTEYTFVGLEDGTHVVQVRAIHETGEKYTETRIFEIDTIEEELTIIEPEDGVESLTYDEEFTIIGQTDTDLTVYVNDEEVDVDGEGEFEYDTTLVEGQNVFRVVAQYEEETFAETTVYALYLPQIPEMQDNIDDLQDEIDDNRDAIDDLEDVTDQLEIDIADLEDELHAEVDRLETALDENVSTLEDAIEENRTDLIDIIEDNITAIEDELADINDDITAIYDELDDINSEINDINSAIDDLNAEINTIQTDIDDLDTEIEHLEGEIDDLEVHLDDLQVQVDELESDIEVELDELQGQIDELESEVEELRENVDELEEEETPGFTLIPMVLVAAVIAVAIYYKKQQ